MGAIQYNSSVTTSDVAVITNSGSDAMVIGSVVAINPGGSAVSITLNVHRTNGYVEPIATGQSIPAGSAAALVDDLKMALNGLEIRIGESLHASASATGLTLLCFD